ncbi:MAG: hypothetical protein IJ911_07930 [Salinivirgaceae bacterium]|nr:hypothetical protein [Salinivirgaceae bacterium]
MKKIIDFFVAAYFSTVYKKCEDRLERGLTVLSIPLGFNGLSLFYCLLPIVYSIPLVGECLKHFSPYTFGVIIFIITVLICFGIKHKLKNIYSTQQYEYIKFFSEKFPRFLLILFVVVHYLGSAFLMIYCMKFA